MHKSTAEVRRGRSAIFLALHFGIRIDPSSRPLGARFVFALSSPLFSMYVDHHFPRVLFALHSPLYAVLPYYLPHARRRSAFRGSNRRRHRLLDFSIFAMCITMHEIVRASEATWDYEMPKIFSTYTRRFGRERRSYLAGLVGDDAQNFELRSFASSTFLPGVGLLDPLLSRARTTLRSNFLDFSQLDSRIFFFVNIG